MRHSNNPLFVLFNYKRLVNYHKYHHNKIGLKMVRRVKWATIVFITSFAMLFLLSRVLIDFDMWLADLLHIPKDIRVSNFVDSLLSLYESIPETLMLIIIVGVAVILFILFAFGLV